MAADTESDRDLDDISPHIRIRIDPEKKLKWLQYADENNLSLTDLIKEAVDNTIDDEWVLESQRRSNLPDIDLELSTLDTNFDEVVSRLESIETQLDDVTLSGTGAEDATEYLERQELISHSSRCLEKLPKVPDGESLIELTSQMAGYDAEEVPTLTGTAPDVAKALGENEIHVRQALIFLEKEQHANVSSIVHDGIRRWYEVNPQLDLDEVIEEIETDLPLEFEPGTEF